MRREAYEVLETMYHFTEDPWINEKDIKDLSTTDKDEVDDILRKLKSKKLIEENHSGSGYKATREGLKLAQQGKLDDSIRALEWSIDKLQAQQARSSAAETIFTLALLGFAAVQILPLFDTRIVAAATLVATAWALLIGGKNLYQVTVDQSQRAASFIFDKLER